MVLGSYRPFVYCGLYGHISSDPTVSITGLCISIFLTVGELLSVVLFEGGLKDLPGLVSKLFTCERVLECLIGPFPFW